MKGKIKRRRKTPFTKGNTFHKLGRTIGTVRAAPRREAIIRAVQDHEDAAHTANTNGKLCDFTMLRPRKTPLKDNCQTVAPKGHIPGPEICGVTAIHQTLPSNSDSCEPNNERAHSDDHFRQLSRQQIQPSSSSACHNGTMRLEEQFGIFQCDKLCAFFNRVF